MATRRSSKQKPKRAKNRDQFRRLKAKVKKSTPGQKIIFQPAQEVKMSEVITEFVEPFAEFAPTYEDYRKLIGLAVVAWNAALLPEDKRQEMLDQLIGKLSLPNAEDLQQLLATLMERKRKYFADNTRFIVSYDVANTADGFFVSVASTI